MTPACAAEGPSGPAGPRHPQRIRERPRHRLLDTDAGAGFGARLDDLGVTGVLGGDNHDVEMLLSQHLLV
ncbi:MAG: hypothetical protein MUF84_16250, partial [Anaerolineae bacterium]|nr:hypothetical protein [Anaerolineae bacterium]